MMKSKKEKHLLLSHIENSNQRINSFTPHKFSISFYLFTFLPVQQILKNSQETRYLPKTMDI